MLKQLFELRILLIFNILFSLRDFFDALQKAAEEEKKKQEVAVEAKVDESGPSDVSGMEPDRSSTSKKGPNKKSAK